jgi:hypothetical protein
LPANQGDELIGQVVASFDLVPVSAPLLDGVAGDDARPRLTPDVRWAKCTLIDLGQ